MQIVDTFVCVALDSIVDNGANIIQEHRRALEEEFEEINRARMRDQYFIDLESDGGELALESKMIPFGCHHPIYGTV